MAVSDPAPLRPLDDAVAAVRGLDVTYRAGAGPAVALRDVDAQFTPGCLSVVAGPSGSGKSSLLRVLAGLLRPDAGHVVVAGVEMSALSDGARRRHRRRAIGVVLQRPSDNLVGYLSALEQVELAARLRGADPAGAPAALDAVGLAGRHGARASELSGGEQQRVAFAAAAAGAPSLLLADEPTAQLDRPSAVALVESMRGLVSAGSSLVVTSHDETVIGAADEVLRLADGRVVQP